MDKPPAVLAAVTILPETVRRVVEEGAAGIYVDAVTGFHPTALAASAVTDADRLLFPAEQVREAWLDSGRGGNYASTAATLSLVTGVLAP